MKVLVSRHHEWREKVIYHGAPSFRIERFPGVLVCIDCGHEKTIGIKSWKPCHRKGEKATSGFGGVLIDCKSGAYLGRFRMAGRHPVTGRPYAQWSLKETA